MRLFTAYQTNNECFIQAKWMPKGKPEGIIVHSTGANNTNLKRYVDAPEEVGANAYGNHWNRAGVYKMVHAFIGHDKDKVVSIANTLPYEYCCWGCGNGSKGSYNYNPAYLQFEICEDGLKDEVYFNDAFGAAIEFCADLCKKYDIPVSNIVSHKEANEIGYASNHGDPDHWLAKFGKTMNGFREEVQRMLDEMNRQVDEYTPSVGEIVHYTGTVHYSNANSTSPKECKPGEATVTRIYDGKHPYHLVNTSGDNEGVYGWVDKEYIKKVDPLPEVSIEEDVEMFEQEVEQLDKEVDQLINGVEEDTKPEIETGPEDEPVVETEPAETIETPVAPETEQEEPKQCDNADKKSGFKNIISFIVALFKKIFSKK